VGLAQLITGSGGYAATVGGTVRVIGSNDVDVISLADIAGKISFDGSFNRGGDFIVLPNAAKTYSIVRASSSITLSDADNTITIPVGSKGTTLQFSDGELVLKFDGQIMIGSQIVTTASAAITTTPSSKTALPVATSASGTLLMAADEPVTVGGNVRVVGTNGADTVTVADVAGNISFDGSFNRGGDKIVVGKFAENYSAARPNASNVTIGDSDTKLTIPMGSKGSSIQFSNESRTLVYSDGNAYLGNQKLGSTTSLVMKFEQNIKYIKVENAFSGDAPLNGDGSSNKPVIFDINNDGYLDILFWWMTNAPVLGGKYAGKPAIAKIQLLVNNKNNTFTDETLKYFINSDIDGTTDSFVIDDFNRDGVPDVVFAANREDGRNTDNPMDAATQLTALISNSGTGTFEIIKFGQKAWYFYINKFNINGITYISTNSGSAEKSSTEVFKFQSGKFELTDSILPEKSASDPWQPFSLGLNYIFYDDDGDGSSDTMYNPNARGPLYVNGVPTDAFTSGIDAYNFNAQTNQWNHLGSYFPMNEKKFVKNVKFISWNLSEGEQPIFEYGPSTYSVRNDVYLTSAMIKVNLLDKPVYASLVGSTFLYSDDIQKIESINEWDLTPRVYVAFFDIVNGALTKVNYKVSGLENMDFFGAHYLYSLDYNKDGYEDLIISTWNKENSPIILLNNKDNSFYKYENVAENKNYISGSFFADFNNDGLVDIFSYISDGSFDIKTADMSQFSLYIASNSVAMG
jgi:hypothetical protein